MRRTPVTFRHSRYEETMEDTEVAEKVDSDQRQEYYPPPARRRASMSERLLRGLSKFVPRLPRSGNISSGTQEPNTKSISYWSADIQPISKANLAD